jgi:hypothetical protein
MWDKNANQAHFARPSVGATISSCMARKSPKQARRKLLVSILMLEFILVVFLPLFDRFFPKGMA